MSLINSFPPNHKSNTDRTVNYDYLSRTKLAFAKQSKADLIRIIIIPGSWTAMGYCWISQNKSVPGSFPKVSVPGRIEMRRTLANDIVT